MTVREGNDAAMWDRERVARQIAAPQWDDPAYLARSAIARALAAVAPHTRGTLVDVGCGTRPYQPLFAPYITRYIGVNYPATAMERPYYAAADMYADGTHLPMRDGCAQTVLCTQVLEHVPEPALMLKEVARVLCAGGTLLLTAPQAWGEHEVPRDFYRYTSWGLRHLLAGAGLLPRCVQPLEGLFATLGQMFLDELAWKILGASRIRRSAIRTATRAINIASARLDVAFPTSRRLCLTYLVTATKEG
jgi:SAM-dependent methyltransferase